MEPGGGRCGGALLLGVDGLVALGVAERLDDVRGQRRLAGRPPLDADEPQALAAVLDELDLAQLHPRPQTLRRPGERLPQAVLHRLEQEDLGLAARRPAHAKPSRNDARVVDDDERGLGELGGQVTEVPVTHGPRRALVHEKAGLVAPVERPLGDQLGREVVVELVSPHAVRRQG